MANFQPGDHVYLVTKGVFTSKRHYGRIVGRETKQGATSMQLVRFSDTRKRTLVPTRQLHLSNRFDNRASGERDLMLPGVYTIKGGDGRRLEVAEVLAPESWAVALINGDCTPFEDDEIKEIDAWQDKLAKRGFRVSDVKRGSGAHGPRYEYDDRVYYTVLREFKKGQRRARVQPRLPEG